MNRSERLILVVTLWIFLIVSSCTFKEYDKGFEGITGLTLAVDSSAVASSQNEVQKLWSFFTSELPVEVASEYYEWTPIFSGSKSGILLVTEGGIAEISEDKERIKYKGEDIYKWASDCYILAMNGKLYCSTFPSALQLLIQKEGTSLGQNNLLNADNLVQYWIPASIQVEDIVQSKEWSFELDGSSVNLFSENSLQVPDSLFRLKIRSILKDGDSFFESLVERPFDIRGEQTQNTIDRCLIWRDGALLLVYNNDNKQILFEPEEISSTKSVYGMADIFQLNTSWQLKLSKNYTYPISDVYAFDWDGLVMMSTNYKVLESLLSYLILEERIANNSALSQEIGGFSARDMKAFMSLLTGLAERTFDFLPEEGFYRVYSGDKSITLEYSNEEDLHVPILLQHSMKKRSGAVFNYFDQQDRLFFLYQDEDQVLYCEDKDGRLSWYIPLEESIKSFNSIDELGILHLGSKLDFIDLKSGRLMDQPTPISLHEVDTFGLITYPDRPALENKIWMQNSDGSFKIQSLDQSAVWNLEVDLGQDLASAFYFGFSDTTDYLLHFKLDSLHGHTIDGHKLCDPIPLKQTKWSDFYKQTNSGIQRLVYPQDNGRVRVLNNKGQHFNLFLLEGMKGLLLENMNKGPVPEYIAYSDHKISISGYSGNDFKTFASYESKEKIESLQYASSPNGHYLACFKSRKVEILNENLELVAKMDCPKPEQAWFYFSDYDSALDLVLIDGEKVLNYILEEL